MKSTFCTALNNRIVDHVVGADAVMRKMNVHKVSTVRVAYIVYINVHNVSTGHVAYEFMTSM